MLSIYMCFNWTGSKLDHKHPAFLWKKFCRNYYILVAAWH